MDPPRQSSRTEITVGLNMLLIIFSINNIFMPMHKNIDEGSDGHKNETKNNATDFPDQDVAYEAATFLGMAFGCLSAGLATYWLGCPKTISRIMGKLVVLSSMLLAAASHYHEHGKLSDAARLALTFAVCAATFGFYLVLYVYTVESVPKSWRFNVGFFCIATSWFFSRLFSRLLVLALETFCQAVLVNACILFVLIIFQDCVRFSSPCGNGGEFESLKELLGNCLALRYVACLSYLWFIYGYTYYGLIHGIPSLSDNLLLAWIYACLLDLLSTVIGYTMCR